MASVRVDEVLRLLLPERPVEDSLLLPEERVEAVQLLPVVLLLPD